MNTMIDKKIQNYQNFFSDQVREAEMEQKSIIKAPMNLLFRKEEIIIGYVDHVNDALGHVVLKFPKDKAPRLKVQKSVMVIKKDAKADLGPNVTSWVCSFLDFCKNSQYHSNTSDLLPLYYTKKEDSNYDYVGCTGLSTTWEEYTTWVSKTKIRVLIQKLNNQIMEYNIKKAQGQETDIEYQEYIGIQIARDILIKLLEEE